MPGGTMGPWYLSRVNRAAKHRSQIDLWRLTPPILWKQGSPQNWWGEFVDDDFAVYGAGGSLLGLQGEAIWDHLASFCPPGNFGVDPGIVRGASDPFG